MGSNVKRIIILLILFMVTAVGGIVLYDNIQSSQEVEEAAGIEESASENAESMQIGDDPRAFLGDETFFEPDKKPYSSIEKMDGKNLSLLMTSVQKDLRIQIVDNAGKLVTGEEFCVVLNGNKEYKDEDKDGIIYIEYLRSGEYEVALKEASGYRVPETNAHITVKQSVEYVVIDDIDLLILTEDEVDAELEDLEANDAVDDADKSEITGMQEGNATSKTGIDVSKWNKEIDWDKVKKAGVEFAIIRVGYRGATTGALIEDPYFEANIKGAIRAGIPVGVYFFTQAVNTVEAVEEASMVTAVSKAFCATMESAGYRAGVYSSRNWLNDMLDMNELRDYVVWLAEYRDVPIYQGYYHMWQYTSKGSVDGIEGNVDFNLSYLRIEDTASPILLEEEPEEQEGEGEAETQEAVPEDEITEPNPIQGAENAEW